MPDFTITSNNPEGLIQQLRIQQTGCGALTKECWAIANQIEEQIPQPAIVEPLWFGSVVKVKTGAMFVRVGAMERHPWVSGECSRSWDEMDVVEVLRVGIGEPVLKPEGVAEGFCSCHGRERALDCGVSAHRREARIYRDPMDDAPEDERGDVAPEETEKYNLGRSDLAYDILTKLRTLRSEAITSERKNAYDTAIRTVEELQP
jgi:hypothetical protein